MTVAEARAQIEQLETEAAALDQDYVDVQVQVDSSRAKLKQKQADVKAQTAKVAKMRGQVGQVALAQFQNRSLDTAAQLLVTDDTEGFLSQVSTVEKVSENQNSVLQSFQSEQANLAALERSAETDLTAVKEKESELAKLRDSSDKKVAESKAVLARLSAQERQILAEEERRAAAVAKAAAEATPTETTNTNTSSSDNSNGKSSSSTDQAVASASGRGAKAIAYARQQLGKPYHWNSDGPGSFDCSGLTLAAWRAAGVSMPHSSRQQAANTGRPVSKSELQAGDLVFYYSPVSHVALYVGNGQIIHAPRPGKGVTYTSLNSMPFNSARRPG